MPPRKGPAQNVVESLRESVRAVTQDAKKQVGTFPRDLVRMLYVDPEHKFKTEEELEQIEMRDKMEKLEGFKQARRELDALQGKITTDLTIDYSTRKHIEEEEKRLAQNLRQFEVTSRDTAGQLGQTPPEQEEQIEQRREAEEQRETERKEAVEKARLENVVETPPGKVTGVVFGKRKRTAPRMMQPPKSAETRTNRE